MIICPECDGNGKGGHAMIAGRLVCVPCSMCNGEGTFTSEQLDRMVKGRMMRDDRCSRGYSLRQEAVRLGISARELSDMEHGR